MNDSEKNREKNLKARKKSGEEKSRALTGSDNSTVRDEALTMCFIT